ncbi:MAG: tetratricopeptide repeat-containing sensor histidine kinase [Bacteroidales bacterium]|nr:tetratricopeptide repeat-containing sensor histidine kinase [Bacteroidales bacterium]
MITHTKKIMISIMIILTTTLCTEAQNTKTDSLKNILETATEQEQIVILNELSDHTLDFSFSEAREFALKSKTLSKKHDDKLEFSKSDMFIGYSYYYEGNFDSAAFYFEQSLNLSIEINYLKGVSDNYTALGGVFNKKGNYDKALLYYNKSLAIDQELGNNFDKAKTYNSIGSIYVKISDYATAIDYYNKAIEIFKLENEEEALANVYANLSNVYYDWGKYEESLEYIDNALKIFEKNDSKFKIAGLLTNKGRVYEKLKEYEKGLDFLNQALEMNFELNNKYGLFNCFGNIARIYKMQENYTEALNYYQKALEVAIEIDYTNGIIVTYNHLGHTFYLSKNYKTAVLNIQKSLELSETHRNLLEIMLSYEYLSKSYTEMKQYENAVYAFENYIAYKDSVFRQDAQKQVEELNVKYEVEKKESEILLLSTQNQLQQTQLEKEKNLKFFLVLTSVLVLLIGFLIFLRFLSQKKNNKLLEEKNLQLSLLNGTKDKFFSIIAHDLKNPLSAFSSITESLFENINELEKSDLEKYLKKMYDSSNNLLDLLHNLLQWAGSQTGKLKCNPSLFDLKELVEKNIQLLDNYAHQKNIEITSQINDNTYIYADVKMIDTVIRNLITNAVKFTNNNGKIKLYTEKSNDFVNFSVEDTGIGLNEKDIEKLFRIDVDTSTIGKSQQKGTGLGLILCKELIEKNNGKIFADSELGKGSVFTFELPVKN